MFCKKKQNPWDTAEEDVVVLHQFPIGKSCPNISPFVMKLENFLRLADIKYIRDFTKQFGPKSKCPWITMNKEDMGDSQLIIEHLINHFNINLDSSLDRERRGALEAARLMVEEHLFWIFAVWRVCHNKSKNMLLLGGLTSKVQRFFIGNFLPILMKRRSKAQGIGLHTEAEQFSMIKKGLESLEALLGERKYFGGDDPCIADCSLFGLLAQLYWTEPETKYENLVKVDYPSLGRYCLSMKDRLYPDWDSLLST